MRNYYKLIPFLLALLSIQLGVVAGVKSKNYEAKIDSLLKIMTLEEKIGQMNQYNGFWEVTGPAPEGSNEKMKYEHLKKGWVGSMLSVRGTENVRKLQELVVKESRLGIPLLFGFDVIHGYKTISPIPLAEAASWDLTKIENSARVAAMEASAVGINWTFGPMVDVSRDARWGRVMEGAGEDPYLGAKVGVARIRGFQGDDLSAPNTIAATAKHFAGYGFVEAGKDYNLADIGTSTLYNIVFPPFKAVVDADVKAIMNSFNTLNGVPATGNKFLQRDVLKGEWGFKGVVLSDWASGAEMIKIGYAENLEDVAEKAANAGSDVDMESHAYIKYLKKCVEEGKVDISVVDDAVRRVLRMKCELGLFDDPYRYCNAQREKEEIYNPKHAEAVLQMAKRSIVLLKNENELLPLQRNQKRIAVIGALANDKNSPLGSWRLASDDNTAVSVIEGLSKYTKEYTYAKGADLIVGKADFIQELVLNETDTTGFAQARQLASQSDVVIMVLGEHAFQTGEARSRTNLDLPKVQQQLLESVYQANKNIVLVLMNGRPLTITWAHDHIPAIVEAWHLGSQSGNAIAQVLFGDYNPSGKLPMTFPRSIGQVPIYYNHYATGRDVNKDNNVFWTHYIDESNKPLYPFGYGLSYTQFKYAPLEIDASNSSTIIVRTKLTNIGKVAGEEVAQLYIHDKVASVARPIKELKGFKKVLLQPNQTVELEFVLTHQELGFYNNAGEFVVEPGSFDVMIGTSSDSGVVGSFKLVK